MSQSRRRKIVSALVGIAVSELAGITGALFSREGIQEWYPTLRKPSFTPPSWIFGPVWTALYALMGVAASIVWRRRTEHPSANRAIGLFSVQLLLNSLWSFAFFKLQSTKAGLAVIVPLWILILLTLLAFLPIAGVAALMLVPYLGWTTFATALNLRLWQLNRER